MRTAIDAAVGAYRRHVELTDDELDRLEAVMYVRPLYLVCFDYRRSVANGDQPSGDEAWWGCIDAEYISATAAATRAAVRGGHRARSSAVWCRDRLAG